MKMKTYIILFNDFNPEIITASCPKEALKFLAIDDLKITIENWNKIYKNKSIIQIMDLLNENLEEKYKICAIYRLKGFCAFSNL